MNTRQRVFAIALIAALGVTAAGCTKVVTTPGGSAANTVTASGSGKVAAPPDLATMSFGVVRRDADASKALSAASSAAEKISAELRKQGIADDDIRTSGVNVYPQYEESGGKSVVNGFEASINVTAKVRDLEKLGTIISALSGAGADSVSGPNFEVDEDSEYRKQAIQEAVDDAKSEAEALAKAAGKQVGQVLSITTTAVNMPGPLGGESYAVMDAAKAVPIETGTLDVAVDVTVIFELK